MPPSGQKSSHGRHRAVRHQEWGWWLGSTPSSDREGDASRRLSLTVAPKTPLDRTIASAHALTSETGPISTTISRKWSSSMGALLLFLTNRLCSYKSRMSRAEIDGSSCEHRKLTCARQALSSVGAILPIRSARSRPSRISSRTAAERLACPVSITRRSSCRAK